MTKDDKIPAARVNPGDLVITLFSYNIGFGNLDDGSAVAMMALIEPDGNGGIYALNAEQAGKMGFALLEARDVLEGRKKLGGGAN